MKVLILEDERLASERLQNLLHEIEPGVVVAATLRTVAAAVDWLRTNEHPDLILSDIRLLDGLCFEIFSQVNVDKPVIFTTAYDQYAIKAFEVNSLDYLLKPVQREKLELSLNKFKKLRHSLNSSSIDYNELLRLIKSGEPVFKSRFMVRLGQKIVALPAEKIAYFSSEHKLTFIVSREGKRYPLDQPLDELIDVLDPKKFFRVNRQFIVTFDAIAEIHPYFKGRLKLDLSPRTDEEVIISSERTPEFKKWIDQ